jgi:hypothetical protein
MQLVATAEFARPLSASLDERESLNMKKYLPCLETLLEVFSPGGSETQC